MSDELNTRPRRALKEAAFQALLDDDRVDELLPTDGHTVVQKPTRFDDSELGDACLRVRAASESSEPRGMIDERTTLVQVQIDWTADWHKSRGPDWEDDIRDAIPGALGRLGGQAFTALGSGGDADADWRDDHDRYIGDATYRYRTADVRES